MEKHGTLADSITRARHYGDLARQALDIFADSPAKSALTDIIDFCIERAW